MTYSALDLIKLGIPNLNQEELKDLISHIQALYSGHDLEILRIYKENGYIAACKYYRNNNKEATLKEIIDKVKFLTGHITK